MKEETSRNLQIYIYEKKFNQHFRVDYLVHNTHTHTHTHTHSHTHTHTPTRVCVNMCVCPRARECVLYMWNFHKIIFLNKTGKLILSFSRSNYPTLPLRTGSDTWSVFRGSNRFSFWTGSLAKTKEPSLSYFFISIVRRVVETDSCHFTRAFTRRETPGSSRIWTHRVHYYDDNRHITRFSWLWLACLFVWVL